MDADLGEPKYVGRVIDDNKVERKVYINHSLVRNKWRISFCADRARTRFTEDTGLRANAIDRVVWKPEISALWSQYLNDSGKWREGMKDKGREARKEALRKSWWDVQKPDYRLRYLLVQPSQTVSIAVLASKSQLAAPANHLSKDKQQRQQMKPLQNDRMNGSLSNVNQLSLGGVKGANATLEHGATDAFFPGSTIPVDGRHIEKLKKTCDYGGMTHRFGKTIEVTTASFLLGTLDDKSKSMIDWIEACFDFNGIRVDVSTLKAVLEKREAVHLVVEWKDNPPIRYRDEKDIDRTVSEWLGNGIRQFRKNELGQCLELGVGRTFTNPFATPSTHQQDAGLENESATKESDPCKKRKRVDDVSPTEEHSKTGGGEASGMLGVDDATENAALKGQPNIAKTTRASVSATTKHTIPLNEDSSLYFKDDGSPYDEYVKEYFRSRKISYGTT